MKLHPIYRETSSDKQNFVSLNILFLLALKYFPVLFMVCINIEHSSITQIPQAKVLQNICQNPAWLLLLFINNSGLNRFLLTRHYYKSMKLQCHTKYWRFLCVCNRFYLMNKLMYWSESQIIPVFFSCHSLCICYMQIYTICNSITLHFRLCSSSYSRCNYSLYTEIHWFISEWNDSTRFMVTLLRYMISTENVTLCKTCTILFISILLIIIGKKV